MLKPGVSYQFSFSKANWGMRSVNMWVMRPRSSSRKTRPNGPSTWRKYSGSTSTNRHSPHGVVKSSVPSPGSLISTACRRALRPFRGWYMDPIGPSDSCPRTDRLAPRSPPEVGLARPQARDSSGRKTLSGTQDAEWSAPHRPGCCRPQIHPGSGRAKAAADYCIGGQFTADARAFAGRCR